MSLDQLKFNTFAIAWVFVLGSAIGSFLNVVIFRTPNGFLLSLPSRSFCPKCKRKLSWFENIPILSYLFLRGKCFGCQVHISPRYPMVEFLTGALFVGIFKFFGFSFSTLYYWLFCSLLIAITFIDLDHRIIPDKLSYPGMVLGMLGSIGVPSLGAISSLEGFALGGLLFGGMAWAYEKFTKREGLGFGDVKLLAMIGAFLGPQGVMFTIVVSSLFGSVVGISLMIKRKANLKLSIPYGPFLAVAAMIFMFWGDYLAVTLYPSLYE